METTPLLLKRIEQVEQFAKSLNIEPLEELLGSKDLDEDNRCVRLSYMKNNQLLQFDVFINEDYETEWYYRNHNTKVSDAEVISDTDNVSEKLKSCLFKMKIENG